MPSPQKSSNASDNLGFIVYPVGRGILDAPVNLHGKLTLPTVISALFSFGKWKNETSFTRRVRDAAPYEWWKSER